MSRSIFIGALAGIVVSLWAAGALAEQPSAQAPNFDDKKLWTGLSGKEGFVTQKWEKAPLYTWGLPGKTALDRQGRKNNVSRNRDPGPDRELPENWLLDGKPATTMPADDQEVDVVLPASETPYAVASPPWRIRHLTIESGAAMTTKMKVEAIKSLSGNLWIKEGGKFNGFSLAVVGTGSAFFRNDNKASGESLRVPQDSPVYLCYWMTIAKRGGASLEFVGEFRLGDELKFNEGVTVIGPGSRVLAGPPSIQIIGPEAVLELQSGSVFGKHSPTPQGQDILVVGELRGGSDKRPLTSDATVALNAKTRPADRSATDLGAALATAGKAAGQINRANTNSLANQNSVSGGYSLAVSPVGRIRIHSSDPAKARLRFVWNGLPALPRRGGEEEAPAPTSGPASTHVSALLLSKDLPLDGVVFDNFFKGGIWVLSGDVPSGWKHVMYGPGNEATGAELFTVAQ
jgi:hypothetical protein